MEWALLFPGQGSQSVGMGKFLFDNFQVAKDLFQEASDAVSVDFQKLCFDGPESDLALTMNTQPAILLTSIATHKVIKTLFPLNVKIAAGHSIGEYSALVSARVLKFSDAIKAVRLRGQFMQEAVPVGEGGMLAVIGLDEEQTREMCYQVTHTSGFGPLEPANFNSPGQVVISGSQKAIDWLKNNFKPEQLPGSPKRAKLIPLQVSAPFHCSMMLPAEKLMGEYLNTLNFGAADFSIIQNYTAQTTHTPQVIKENLIKQISAPVKWSQSMQTLKEKGIANCVEVGNGKVLTGLLKKIDGEFFKAFNINSIEDLSVLEKFSKGET